MKLSNIRNEKEKNLPQKMIKREWNLNVWVGRASREHVLERASTREREGGRGGGGGGGWCGLERERTRVDYVLCLC